MGGGGGSRRVEVEVEVVWSEGTIGAVKEESRMGDLGCVCAGREEEQADYQGKEGERQAGVGRTPALWIISARAIARACEPVRASRRRTDRGGRAVEGQARRGAQVGEGG